MIDIENTVPRYELTDEERHANLEYTKARTAKLILENKGLEINLRDTEASPDEAQVYPYFDEIGPVSAARFIQTTSLWSRRNPGSDITVVLNSIGGSVFSGLGVYDHIMGLRAKGHQVTIKVLSLGASMAAIVLQAGSKRLINSNALLLLHEGGAELSGSMAMIADTQKMIKILDERTTNIVVQRTGMSVRKYKALIKRQDKWLTAEESLELGLVDAITD
jgi:ATP-dependent Clp protease protease subunit